jgi:phospholipase C
MTINLMAPAFADGVAPQNGSRNTLTPIKHVIIIVGENRTFDHLFATYQPKNGQTVLNLLSQGIVKADGSPGPNYSLAKQYSALEGTHYQLAPTTMKKPFVMLPPFQVGGPAVPYVCQLVTPPVTGTSCVSPQNLLLARSLQFGLDDSYYQYMLTGGTGQPSNHEPDARLNYFGNDASHLPNGPFWITNTSNPNVFPYDSYAASPVHRLFQMWQQMDCDASAVTAKNGWGCRADLFPWVEITVAAGSNGKAEPPNYIGEGSTAMGFYNVHAGDMPYFKKLADQYTISDNYHQPVMGGTGANSFMLGAGDLPWFSDGNGNPKVPPNNPVNPQAPGTPVAGHSSALNMIENPDPMPGTNNFYAQDGYGGGSGSPTATSPNANYGGGSYVNCSDPNQPGVDAVRDYLARLPRPVKPNCESGHYYLVNNYNPGYFGDGSNAYTNTDPKNTVFTIPPSTTRTIADTLTENQVSWAYYGDQWDIYLAAPLQLYNDPRSNYCNICNFAQFTTSIMSDATVRTTHLKDLQDFYAVLAGPNPTQNLPAVSYIKPSGIVDGHPNSSKFNLFEGFVKKIVDTVQANPRLWAETAIFITVDEGGGYYDSGYVQPLDFFGDGTRIPMIVVSPYSIGGRVSHTYTDHVSTLKFIEKNWNLPKISNRSRDNLPNPTPSGNPYVPANSPAIGDMVDMFNFFCLGGQCF